jgi:hypothetical protein
MPQALLRREGAFPDKAALRLTPPPGFGAEEFRERPATSLDEREALAAREARGGFLGVAYVLAQKPMDRPQSG